MKGRVKDGEVVTLRPLGHRERVKPGQVVLAKVNGRLYLHLVKAVQDRGPGKEQRVLIGNNKGKLNGWTGERNVYGVLVEQEGPKGREG